MKKIILSLLIIHFSLIIANAQWVQMSNGMGNNNIINTFASLGNNIFAGANYFPSDTGGVYISTNNGVNWTFTGLNNQIIRSFATLGTNIFAGTYYNGIYLSTNNGTNWTQTTLNNLNVYSLATLGTNIFAGTLDSGIYLSTNTGSSWAKTNLNYRSIYSLAMLGNNIFAGTDSGVYISTNNGISWIQTGLNDKSISSLAISGNNIFAGVDGGMYLPGGIYFSTNNGMSWTQTALNIDILSLAASGNNIFAGTIDSGLYLSTNNGINWIKKNQGFNIISNSITNFPLFISNNYIFASIGITSNPFGYGVWRRDLSEIIGIQNISSNIPDKISLYQNYPNPFNPVTKIKFDIAGHTVGQTFLSVYDITGREIQTLVNEKLNPGTYEVTFDGSNFASGVYFYSLSIENKQLTAKKMILLK